ncbi:MAG: VCBS repeat-containing protein [Bryobacterales bacterium]|nr:VCBS repeat-containing protein [Bryobacterales bacterium]
MSRIFPCALILLWIIGPLWSASLPEFRESNIVSGLKMGYQLVLADLNRDGKLDVIVVDELSSELAWYENPGWQRHVLARDVSRTINLDCHDLDGDGIPEIAMAHDFETNPDRSKGTILLLEHNGDPREPWKKTELGHVPTAHRLRWMPVEKGKPWWLLVAPIVGEKTYPPDYVGIAPIYAYRPGEWKQITVSDQLRGVLHSIAPVEWQPGVWRLLTASFDGIELLEPRSHGIWKHVQIGAGNPVPCPKCGSSEVKMGKLGNHRFLATIEPWHGNQIAVYLERKGMWQRIVLDEELVNGHALAVADLDGDGRDEIVSGFRGKGFRVTVYQAEDAAGQKWGSTVLNTGGVAGADCKIADLNGDDLPDIVCSGASTGNVMLFENKGRH